MSKEKELDLVYINIANQISTLSKCNRSKVGAILVKDGNIISMSYNGTPKGTNNCCEDENNQTFSYVIHAEMGAILKAAKTGNSITGSTLYVTLAPCMNCSKYILQSEIKRVVYLEDYRDMTGVEFLRKFIKVEKYEY